MAVDTSAVSKLDVEPGTLPETMAAWVIRQDREGEPNDAFQLEQIEVPEPGAFEVIVRVMAAGVNFNNVWAALGKPVSVFGYGDHPEYGHHIGGSDASGIVWKVGEGVTRWKPGDEVVVHCNQASYEDVEVHGLDPLAAPSQKIWGYETTWGSFAQFTKVQAQQLLPRPQNLSWAESSAYGLTYFTAYRMLIDQCKLQPGHNVLIWGAAGGLGVFAVQLCKAAGANAVGVVSSEEKGELVKQLGAVDYINRNEFREMMRTPENLADTCRRQGALQSLARLRQAGQGDPRRRPRHRLRARRPGDLPNLGLRRQAVRQGRYLRRHLGLPARLRRPLPVDAPEADHRLSLRQRLRVHAREPADGRGQGPAGASGRRWASTGLPSAHQLLHENKHLGKISILVGAESEDEGKNEDGAGSDPGGGGSLMSRSLRTGLAHRPLPGGPLARPVGARRGADAGFRRQELVADPLDRRSALLPADIGLGEPGRLRALLVLGGDRGGRAPRSSTSTTCRFCPPGTRS